MLKKFKLKLNIQNRLLFGFGAITLGVFISFLFIRKTLVKSQKITNKNIYVYTPSKDNLGGLSGLLNDSKLLIKNWVYIDKHSDTPDKKRLETLHTVEYQRLKDTLHILSNDWNTQDKLKLEGIFTTLEDTLFTMHKQIMNLLSSFDSYDDPMVMFEVMPLVGTDGDVIKYTQKVNSELSQLTESISTEANESNISLVNSLRIFNILIIVVGIGLITIAVGAAIFTVKSIVSRIQNLKTFITNISQGKLFNININKSNDEIGEMAGELQNMTENLRNIVESIKTGANIVAKGSKNINNSSREIASGANQQAASAEEVSASMEQMTSSIAQNSDNSQHTEKIAKKVSEEVQIINNSVKNTSKAMNNIAEKILIINDIAERIDLLAINAAIEAARAGEHGKGFAVVASEVRNLAESSQNAANDIDRVSKDSVSIAEESSKLLEGIIPDIQNTLSLVAEITASGREQNSGISQINEAIHQLTIVTQQNTIFSEDLSTGSAELLHQSSNLIESISFFKTEDSDSDEGSIKELEEQILKLQELILKRKDAKETKVIVENKTKKIPEEKSKPIIDIQSPDTNKNDNEFEKY